MQRKKPDKLNFAMPVSNSDYYQLLKGGKGVTLPENTNESLFCKYASSIIQVISQDKLDFSCSGGTGLEQKNAVFQISEVNDLRGEGVGKGNSFYQESNNYNNIAAKMKKKGGNRKLLSYNFSNLTIFNEALNRIFKKNIKNCFDLVRYWSNGSTNTDYNKTKKEIKRSSFHSGYTTSTSNQQKIGKKQSKKLTQQKKKDIHRQAAHQIKGFLQFKILLFVSQAFNSITSYVSGSTGTFNKFTFGVSQVSTIKNQPLQHFYLTQYSQNHQMSIVKEVSPNMSESLIYTVDKNFAFTEEEIAVTTQKMTPSVGNQTKSPFANIKMMKHNTHQSIVQPYRPKQSKMPPKPASIKEKPTTAVIQPLKFNEMAQRRYLTVRTNIYQLPLLSKNELKTQQLKGIKNLSLFEDRINRSQPQGCSNHDTILLELAQADHLFKSKVNNSKNMENSKRSNKTGPQKLDKSQSDKWSTTNELIDQDNKKFNSTTNLVEPVKEQKKQAKVSEYYLNQNVSSKQKDKNKFTNNINYQKKVTEPLKSIEPTLNPIYRSQQKSQKAIRFDESVVNQFKLYEDRKHDLLIINKSQARAEENKPIYFKENDKKQQKGRSTSKINVIMQSPRRQSPKVQLYGSPISHGVKPENKPIIKNNEKDKYYSNNPYCYPIPQQRPTSPKIMINEQKTIVIPQKQQNVYQMSQGVTYMKQPGLSQKMANPVLKKNEKTNMHQPQIRVQNHAKMSPGKVVNPNYLINSHEKRHNPILATPSQLKKDDKKPSFYSPQMGKQVYMQSPQKYVQMEPQKVHNPVNNLRRMHTQQQYFIKQNTNQHHLRAINFNNNYYTNGPQTTRPIPIVNEVNRNVFQQDQSHRKQVRFDRPPSSTRQSIEKANMISNYMSPLESQLQYQQRSNNFSKNSSELSRPKSMNQKIFITLRKDK